MTMNLGGINPYVQMGMDAPLMNAGTAMGMPPMTMGMAPMGGMGYAMYNPQYQMNTMAQWDKFGVQRQVDTFQNQNNAQFKMSAQTDRIARQIQILNSKAKDNSQNHIETEYNKLVAAVKDTYGSQLTQGVPAEQAELQIKAYAEKLYAQQTGSYLTDDIKSNSSNSFVQGIKQVLSFGLGNNTTADENIAKIQGTSLSKSSKAAKIAGNIVGGLMGGLIAVGSFLFFKGKKA